MLPKVIEFFTKHFEVWWSVSVDISRVHEVIKAHDVCMSQRKPWKVLVAAMLDVKAGM